MTRFLVIRVPSFGPTALAGPPNDFASRAEVEARIRQIEAGQRIAHHTHLEVLEVTGDRAAALRAAGVLE